MRRKITEAKEAKTDLPELTERQKKFVFGILSGYTASDAYRAAYDCSNMQPNSIWCEASKLRSHPNVSQWLAAAREAGLGQAKVTLESHLTELERLREIALRTGNVGAAVQAEQLRGKATGHYTEKLEVTTGDPIDIMAELATLVKANPDLAKELALSGITPGTDTKQ